jgi:16S rRNA processing protein RimM
MIMQGFAPHPTKGLKTLWNPMLGTYLLRYSKKNLEEGERMQQQLLIANVLKPQGIRGEIKLKYFTDTPQDIKNFPQVIIDGKSYKVLSFRTDGEAVYLGLYGVADRNLAEALRGKDVFVDRKDVPMPKDGTYYIVDLLGCKVITEQGKELGVLTKIVPAATDVYTITQGEQEILFPAVGDLFVQISPETGTIVVNEERFLQVAVL